MAPIWQTSFPHVPAGAVRLAGRRGVDSVETIQRERERVSLVEFVAAVVRLRLVVDTYHVEPGLLVALRCATRTTKQVQQPRLHDASVVYSSRVSWVVPQRRHSRCRNCPPRGESVQAVQSWLRCRPEGAAQTPGVH